MHKAFSLESIHHVKHFNSPDVRLYELLLRIVSPRSISLASTVISTLVDRQLRQTEPITVKSVRRKCVMGVVEMVDISQSSKLIQTTHLAGQPSCGCRGGNLPIFGNPFSTFTHEVGEVYYFARHSIRVGIYIIFSQAGRRSKDIGLNT